MGRRPSKSGFTLLELVLVMVIMMIVISVAAPNLKGWRRGAHLRNSAEELMMLTRYARTQAITEAKTYVIEFNANAGKYQLRQQTGQGIIDVTDKFGRIFSVPEGGRMLLTKLGGGINETEDKMEAIFFYPSGRTQAARIEIFDGQGFKVEIECQTPAEDFRVSYEGVVT